MTILQIKDEKGKVMAANKAIFEARDVEKRSMTPDENTTVAKNLNRLDELDLELRSAGFETSGNGTPVSQIFKTSKPVEQFSLLRAIKDSVGQKPFSKTAADVFAVGAHEFMSIGEATTGTFQIPLEVRANILAGTTGAGEEVVAEDKHNILPPLVDALVFSQAGTKVMAGLVGDVSIPTYSGTTVLWKDEVEAAVDGGGTFTEVNMQPKRITGYVYISKTFLAQDAAGAEQLLYSNIVNAAARKIEETVLGVAIGSATVPAGMGYKLNTLNVNTEAGQVPTHALMVQMEADVDSGNALKGNLAYITNSGGRATLKSIERRTTDATGGYLAEDGIVNDYPLIVTNSCSATAGTAATDDLIVFGAWQDLLIAQWGGYDVTIDPYTRAGTNQVVMTINTYVDVKNARGTSGAGADIIDYPISFTQHAIKAS